MNEKIKKELALLKNGKVEQVAVHLHSNKLFDQNVKTMIQTMYSELTEDIFEFRTCKKEYIIILFYMHKYGFPKEVIEEIIKSAKTKDCYKSLVCKPKFLLDFFYAYENARGFDPEIKEKVLQLQKDGIIPEIPEMSDEDKRDFQKGIRKIWRDVVRMIGISMFE
ncbi:MAG: hypothetical protein E7012_01010 [Alphaproteobacteria bacterium]|nr:hypothetical protein [Alphaproteobacteria bacterium]